MPEPIKICCYMPICVFVHILTYCGCECLDTDLANVPISDFAMLAGMRTHSHGLGTLGVVCIVSAGSTVNRFDSVLF